MEIDIFNFPNTNNLKSGIRFRISTLYSEISEQNFREHKNNMDKLTSSMIDFFNGLEEVFIAPSEKEIENFMNELGDIDKYEKVLNSNKIDYEKMIEFPKESLEFSKAFLSNIRVDQVELKKMIPNPELFNETMKSGIIAISFEAFACEALINEELLRITSKNQINKISKQKGIQYLNKLEEIIKNNKKEIEVPDLIKTKIKKLMKKRNKIVHIKEYNYDLNELIKFLDLNKYDINEEMYIGDLIKNINYFQGTYSELARLLIK